MKGYSVWVIVQVEAETKAEACNIVAMSTILPPPASGMAGQDLDFEVAKVEPVTVIIPVDRAR